MNRIIQDVVCRVVGPPLDVFLATGGGGGGSGVSSLNGETGPVVITGSGGIAITTPSATTVNVDGSGISGGVSSVNTFTGVITIAAGSGITVTNLANNITIAATGGGAGVTSLNTLTGALSITSPDSFLSVSTSGSTVRLSAGSGSFVTLSTTQTITGDKTFTGAVAFGNGASNTSTFNVDTPNGASFKSRVFSDVVNPAITARFIDGLVGSISGATNATPIVIHYALDTTATAPQTGDKVIVSGVLGNTAANGNWTITVVDPTHFSLDGSTGNGAYTSGGNAYWDTSDDPEDSQATNIVRLLDSTNGLQPTSGIYFDTIGTGFRNGIIFGTGSIKTAGYGLDFRPLATTVPIRLANATAIKGRNAADNADVSLFGINASNAPTVGPLVYPTVDGTQFQVFQTDGAGTVSIGSPWTIGNSWTFPSTTAHTTVAVPLNLTGGDVSQVGFTVTSSTRMTLSGSASDYPAVALAAHFDIYVEWGDTHSDDRIVEVKKNGSSLSTVRSITNNATGQMLSTWIGGFVPGDYFEVVVTQSSGGDKTATGWMMLSGGFE